MFHSMKAGRVRHPSILLVPTDLVRKTLKRFQPNHDLENPFPLMGQEAVTSYTRLQALARQSSLKNQHERMHMHS